MQVNIKVIVLHLDLNTNCHYCLLENNELPTCTLDTPDVPGALQVLLIDYLEIDPEWVSFYLIEAVGENASLSLVYTCMIPSIIKNKKGTWINIGDIEDEIIKTTLFQAIHKIV